VTTLSWLPEPLHPVALRLARADQLAYELAMVLLSWSRGSDNAGALKIRQVERTPGYYDVEVASIRPTPPVAGMLFSEAISHLRAALDNVVYYLAEQEHGQPLSVKQAKTISMPISDTQAAYEQTIRNPIGKGLSCFDPTATLGGRLQSIQPFIESTTVPSMSSVLANIMGVTVSEENPLTLLREYSNHDKHRAMRITAGQTLVQRDDDWRRSVTGGMRPIEVGTVLETVKRGAFTGVELSPALLIQRPDGIWVAIGPELDGIARYVSDIAIPTLVVGMSLPGGLPVNIDLADNGQTIVERASGAGTVRAHARARVVMTESLLEANEQAVQWPETVNLADEATDDS
jgi:hypothetical protein